MEVGALELADSLAIVGELLSADGPDGVRGGAGRRVGAAGAPEDGLLRHLAVGRAGREGRDLPDFPPINNSFELCYACDDR